MDLIQYDLGGTLVCEVEDSTGTAVAPSAGGTCTCIKPDGTTLKTGTITVSGTEARFSLLTTDLSDSLKGEGYRAKWTLTYGGSYVGFTYVFETPFTVCRWAPPNPITEGLLLKRHGNLLTLIRGTGETSLGKWRQNAWEEFQRWLSSEGDRVEIVLRHDQILVPLRDWALHLLFLDLSTVAPDSGYAKLADDYGKSYQNGLEKLTLHVSEDDNGLEDEPHAGQAPVFAGELGDWEW